MFASLRSTSHDSRTPGIRRALAAALAAAFALQTSIVAAARCDIALEHGAASAASHSHDAGHTGTPTAPTKSDHAPDAGSLVGACATCVVASLTLAVAVSAPAAGRIAPASSVPDRLASFDIAPDVPPPKS